MTDPIHTEARDPHGRFAHTNAPVPSKPAGARDGATDAARRAAAGIDANPIGILVGGLALGALAGALIPRSAQEKELLEPIGKQIGGRARAAFDAARETARTELSEAGLTKNAARSQVRGLLENLVTVAQNVGSAAAKSAAEKA